MARAKGWEIRGRPALIVAVVADVAALAAVSVVNLVHGDVLTGTVGLVSAAVLGFLLLVLRQVLKVASVLADRLARERIAARETGLLAPERQAAMREDRV